MRDSVQPPQRLPLPLPIVLYSGESRWNAPTRVADLVDEAPPVLQPYQPDIRYLVLDEGALVQAGSMVSFRTDPKRVCVVVRARTRTAERRCHGNDPLDGVLASAVLTSKPS